MSLVLISRAKLFSPCQKLWNHSFSAQLGDAGQTLIDRRVLTDASLRSILLFSIGLSENRDSTFRSDALTSTPLQAAICGPLMVEDHIADPLAGARLLRAFLAGPQDLSLSETANETSRLMWSRLRGKVLPSYSLEWVRVLRPAAFFAEAASKRFVPLKYFKALASPFDTIAHRVMKTDTPPKPQSVSDNEIALDKLAPLITSCLKDYELRPDWAPSTLSEILATASTKSTHGTLHSRVVHSRNGVPLGAYLFHGDRGKTARVLQIIALKGHEPAILESLLHYAHSIGAVAVRARSQPRLMEAMMINRGIFFQRSSTVVHARDPQVLEAFSKGDAFFNGLAGEGWNRLNGDEFA